MRLCASLAYQMGAPVKIVKNTRDVPFPSRGIKFIYLLYLFTLHGG